MIQKHSILKEKLLINLLQHTSDIVIVVSKEFKILFLNKKAEQFYNWNFEDICGRNFIDICFVNHLDCPISADYFGHVSFVETTTSFNDISRKLNPVNWIVSPLQNDKNIIDSAVIIGKREIINKKMITHYLNQIIEHTPGSLYWKDINGRYLGCNDFMIKTSKLKTRNEIVGKTDHDLWPENAAVLTKNDQHVLKTGETIFTEETVQISKGTKVWFTSVKMPLKDENNKIIGVIGNSLDITQQKKVAEELERAKIKADEVSENKSRFIRNMEHDLRTPASGIASFAELLATVETDKTKKEKLTLIADAGKRLLTVLNSILEFNNANTKESPVVEKSINIRELVLGIAELEQPTANVKQLELKTTISEEVQKYLLGDEFRLNRILINLISNSIKYTHSGFVHTKIEIAKQTEELPQKKSNSLLLEIMVEDSGIGIPKNKLDFIYEKFYRVHESNQGIYSGSGLGLYLVKNFIDDLEGQIVVYSELDRGTKVRCSIPVKKSLLEPLSSEEKLSAKKRISNQYAVPQQQLKILLVEDDIIAQTVALFFLRNRFNCDVSAVFDGNTAVSLTDSQNYVLIFLDLGLPDKNGIDVAKEIRLKPDYANTPIIALTAHNEQYTRKKGANIINDFLSKPITPEKIQEVFDRWIPQPDQNKL